MPGCSEVGFQDTTKTLAELRAEPPESLWDFLAALPFILDSQILCAVLIFGCVGMFGSWIVKWSMQGLAGGVLDYFFRASWKRTVATVCGYLAVMLPGVGTELFFVSIEGVKHFVGWDFVAWTSLMTAFGADMGINRGRRAQWSDEQRDSGGKP